jgi:transposase
VDVRPPTPPQVRRVIVRLRQEGRTYEQIAELVGVGTATVNRILRRHRETGALEPLAPGGGNLSPLRGPVASKLKALVAALPDATVAEMAVALRKAEKLSTSRSSVQRALVRLGYSRKKSPSSR